MSHTIATEERVVIALPLRLAVALRPYISSNCHVVRVGDVPDGIFDAAVLIYGASGLAGEEKDAIQEWESELLSHVVPGGKVIR